MHVQNKFILSQNLKIYFKTKSQLYNLNAVKKKNITETLRKIEKLLEHRTTFDMIY